MLSRAWNRFQISGYATQSHDGGGQRATTPRQDRFLVVQVRRHPFVNATTLRNELKNAVRGACIRIPLTRLHKQARLNLEQDHVNWSDNGWDPVLFIDESRYCLDFADRRARVWRKRGEQYL